MQGVLSCIVSYNPCKIDVEYFILLALVGGREPRAIGLAWRLSSRHNCRLANIAIIRIVAFLFLEFYIYI